MQEIQTIPSGELDRLSFEGYTELNVDKHEIRVMRVLPGSNEDPLCCILATLYLDEYSKYKNEHPEYEALSYVWGNPNPPATISINDQSVHVTKNLEEALRHLRSASAPRIIWADAICINQGSDREKSHQIQQMSRIYESASRVIAWLGPSNRKSHAAFEFVENISTMMNSHPETSVAEYKCRMEAKPAYYAKSYDALCKLLKRPWFTRVWTFQEFASASPIQGLLVVCGQDHLDWRPFWNVGWLDKEYRRGCPKMNLPSSLSVHFRKSEEYWGSVSRMEEIRMKMGFGYDLSFLLRATAQRAASDPRDRIYALLACATKECRQNIVPDYEKTPMQVYTEAVQCIIEEEKSLNILAFQEFAQRQDYPSWLPDFSSLPPENDSPLLPPDLETPSSRDLLPPDIWLQYSASGLRRPPTFQLREDKKTLSVKGIEFSLVNEVIGPSRRLKLHLRRAEQCAKRAVRQPLPHDHPCYYLKRDRALWRVFLANKNENGHVPAPATYKRMMETLLGRSHICGSRGREGKKVKSGYLAPVERSLDMTLGNRTFFATDTGFVGIGSKRVQKGDVVAILNGGDMPFVLRPDGPFHRLIGAAYVHGIMYGEVMAINNILPRGSRFQSRWFQLQ
jgi:hypothetical protein